MAASSDRAAGAVFRLVQAGLFPAAVLAYAVFVVRFLRAARRAGARLRPHRDPAGAEPRRLGA